MISEEKIKDFDKAIEKDTLRLVKDMEKVRLSDVEKIEEIFDRHSTLIVNRSVAFLGLETDMSDYQRSVEQIRLSSGMMSGYVCGLMKAMQTLRGGV